MAVVNVKLSLTQKGFPMHPGKLVDCAVRDNGFDQSKQLSGGEDAPQAYFLQNVLPQQRGFTSAHFTRVVTESTYPSYMDDIIQLRDSTGAVALLSPAGGKNFIYTANTAVWTSQPLPSPSFSGKVSSAYLKGVTYVCYEGVGLYAYDFNTDTYAAVSVSGGITFADILGVCSAGNYLILYTAEYIAYSSPLDPTDFTPALGAGGQSQILSNKGVIVDVRQAAGGMIVYTTVSAIFAQLTNNVNFPLQFSEIPKSAGITNGDHVAAAGDTHVAWTTSGLMLLNGRGAQLTWPELSDEIASGVYHKLVGDSIVRVETPSLDVKISNIGTRYIAVSLRSSANSTEYSYCYLFDTALERWGRLDIPHIALFEYRAAEFSRSFVYDELTSVYDSYTEVYADLAELISAQETRFGATLGVVGKLGAVYVVLTADYSDVELLESPTGSPEPAVVLGKYKLVSGQSVQAVSVDAGVTYDASFVFLGHDAAGATVKTAQLVESSRQAGTFLGRCNSAAISVLAAGRFSLTSCVLSLVPQGSLLRSVLSSEDAIPANSVVVSGVPVSVSGEYVTNG